MHKSKVYLYVGSDVSSVFPLPGVKILDLRNMAASVYSDGGDSPPPGWQSLVNSSEVNLDQYGYHGAAYYNQAGIVVIAHRGAEVTDIRTLRDDAQYMLDYEPDAYTVARKFNAIVKECYLAVFHDKSFETNAIHTGHSLGAILAELSAVDQGTEEVSFESPGTYDLMAKTGRLSKINPAKIHIYNTNPNMIDTFAPQISDVTHLYPLPKLSSSITPRDPYVGFPLDYHLKQHFLSSIDARYFDPATGLPHVTSFVPKEQWPKFADRDFDLNPYYWWKIQMETPFFGDVDKKLQFIKDKLGGGVQNPKPQGHEVDGDDSVNTFWMDTTGDDRFVAKGGEDKIYSFGGDDDIDLGVNSAPDNAEDTIYIITTPGTSGARQVHAPDTSDQLIWDDATVSGKAQPLPQGGYSLNVVVKGQEQDFVLSLTGNVLVVKRVRDTHDNSVTVHDFFEGALGIYLNPQSYTECAPGSTINGNTSAPQNLSGTCGGDVIDADATITSGMNMQLGGAQVAAQNADDDIIAGPGDDRVFAGSRYLFFTDERNNIDLGAGNDRASGSNGIDIMHGGLGDDVMTGGVDDSTDMFDREANYPYLPDTALDVGYGDDGNDKLYYFEQAFGGAGNDYIELRGSTNQYADGGPDDDYIVAAFDNRDNFSNHGPLQFVMDGGPGDDILQATKLLFISQPDTSTFIMRGEEGQNTYVIHPQLLKDGATIVIEPGADDYAVQGPSIWMSEVGLPQKFDPAHPYFGSKKIADVSGISTQYNQKSGALTITRSTVAALSAGRATPQATLQPGQIIIQNFFNGMFGITGIQNAPAIPTEPISEQGSMVYLPLVTGGGAHVRSTQGGHPMAAAHPEHIAYTKSTSLDEAAMAATIFAPGIVYGGRAVAGLLPRSATRPIHNAIESVQTELDVAHIRADAAFNKAKGWLRNRLGNRHDAA
jgi:hypothetical protein